MDDNKLAVREIFVKGAFGPISDLLSVTNNSMRERHSLLLVIVVWIFLQFPFWRVAFRIDEPFYLAIAEQISVHPLDPYRFRLNWLGTSREVSEIFANPPLVPFWLAFWQLLFPRNEVSLHIAMLPFSVLALHSFALLARHLKVDPLLSLALLCCSPAFFLGSQVVMLDVPMLCFFLVAISYAAVYEQQGNRLAFTVALLAALLTPLAKYNGMLLLPLLLWLLTISKRKAGMALIAVAPIFSVVFWNALTWMQYGKPNLWVMADLQKNLQAPHHFFLHGLGILASVGLGVLPVSLPLFIAQIIRLRMALILSALIVVPFAYVFSRAYVQDRFGSAFLMALGTIVCVQLVLVAFRQVWKDCRSRVEPSLWLALWILLGLAAQAGFSAASTRYALFLAPPAILIVLAEVKRFGKLPSRALVAGSISINLVFVLTIAVGDAMVANGYRDFLTRTFTPTLQRGGKFYFAGHWGFQYYAEQLGGEALDSSNPQTLRKGDLAAIATNAWPGLLKPRLEAGQELQSEVHRFSPDWIVKTIACEGAANFYGNRLPECSVPTLLPFALTCEPSEVFLIHRVQDGGSHQASNFWTTLPATSVKRKSRP